MSFYILRDQQQYGPYSLQDLQTYAAAGSISTSDQTRDSVTGVTSTVAQVLAYTPSAYAAPAYTPATPSFTPPVSAYVAPPIQPGAVPLPPNLHWGLVLLITVFFSPFQLGWTVYQMVWVRNIDRQSKALLYFLLGLIVPAIVAVIGVVAIVASSHGGEDPSGPGLALGVLLLGLAWIACVVMLQLSFFNVRSSMVTYYNSTEPIGLRLSAAMTFFFSTFYFQHHMSRIATWKTTGYLAPQG